MCQSKDVEVSELTFPQQDLLMLLLPLLQVSMKNAPALLMVHKEGGCEFSFHSPRGYKKEQKNLPTFCFMIPVVQKEFEMCKYQSHYWVKYICGAYGCKYHGSHK